MNENDKLHIPVSMAREVANLHDKDVLILVAWDEKRNVTNFVSWGRSAVQKDMAAKAAAAIAQQVGCTVDEMKHEDYRTTDQAKRAEEIENLRANLLEADGALRAVRGILAREADDSTAAAEIMPIVGNYFADAKAPQRAVPTLIGVTVSDELPAEVMVRLGTPRLSEILLAPKEARILASKLMNAACEALHAGRES